MKLIRTLAIPAAALLLAACGGGHSDATTNANTPAATSAVTTARTVTASTAGGVATTVASKSAPVTLDPQVDAVANEADQALAAVDKTFADIDQSLKDAAANGD